jgi:superfamily II DNA or RNA helicase
MSVTLNSGLLIPKDHPEYEVIKKDLTRNILGWNGDNETFKFFVELKNKILIPRFYPVNDKIIDKRPEGEDIDIESFVTPRNDRQKSYIKSFLEKDSGVIKAEPGTGKTVMSCAAIGLLKKKSIILVHKNSLLNQWKESLINFTSLEEDDIGILSTNKYKKEINKPVIICTPHIIAYAVKNKKNEFLKSISNANFGIMIVDECHIGVGPEKFSLASISINAKRIYGLSATPSRTDNNDIIHFHLGEIIKFNADKEELIIPKIFQIHIPFGIYTGKKIKYLRWGGNFQLTRYFQQMKNAKNYNKKVSRWINDAYENGRTVLVLGNQIKPLLELCKECKLPKEHVGIFIPGAMDKKKYPLKHIAELTDTRDLKEAFHNKAVVFSTYQAARDGNNREDLDCLIMYCPTNNIEQAAGRILRKKENKKKPIVLDLVDTQGPLMPDLFTKGKKVPWFIRSSQKRMKEYKRLGWEVEVKKL